VIYYVLSNPAFNGYIKLGKTKGKLMKRLKELDNASVPLPFECEYAMEVENENIEELIYQTFSDSRVRSNREFFKLDPQQAISALKIAGGKDVTPRENISQDKNDLSTVECTQSNKKRNYTFQEMQIYDGDTLEFTRDSSITVTVVGDRKINFEGEMTSFSKAA